MSCNYTKIVDRFLAIQNHEINLDSLTFGDWRPVTDEGKTKLKASILQCKTSGQDLFTGVVRTESISVMPKAHVDWIQFKQTGSNQRPPSDPVAISTDN